jgi:hypothetical protein
MLVTEKKLRGMTVPAVLLLPALLLVMMTVGCSNEPEGKKATALEGKWNSADGDQTITFTENDFTGRVDDDIYFKGSFTLSGANRITMTITHLSTNGIIWLTPDQLIDVMIDVMIIEFLPFLNMTQAQWNALPPAQKQALRNQLMGFIGANLSTTQTGTYALSNNNTVLTMTYADVKTFVFYKDNTISSGNFPPSSHTPLTIVDYDTYSVV